jgi:predicted transcriptional regulator
MTVTLSFSLPDDIAEELDQLVEKWRGSRSAAITRIYLEWKQANRPQLPLAEVPAEAPEVAEVTR